MVGSCFDLCVYRQITFAKINLSLIDNFDLYIQSCSGTPDVIKTGLSQETIIRKSIRGLEVSMLQLFCCRITWSVTVYLSQSVHFKCGWSWKQLCHIGKINICQFHIIAIVHIKLDIHCGQVHYNHKVEIFSFQFLIKFLQWGIDIVWPFLLLLLT